MREFDKNKIITKRLTLIVITLFAFLFLLTGFMRLQVMNQEQYVQKSIDNSIRKIQRYPVRGLILDSENNILVDNRSSFSIAVIPKVVETEKLKELCEFLQIDYEEVLDKIKKQYGFRPVIIARDVTNQTLIAIEEQRQDLPGVITMATSKRYYPDSVNSPHIFGTIGEINPERQ
ncbi:MAG: hypothetical protein P8Y99_06515 [Calditrichaceae bacterium]